MEGTLQPSEGIWVKTLSGAIGHDIKLLIPAMPSLNTSQLFDDREMPWYTQIGNWFFPAAHADNTGGDKTWDYSHAIGYDKRKEKKARGKKRLRDGSDWYVRLTVEEEQDSLKDRGNVFGHLADSVDGFDAHDLEELDPFSTPYLTLVFPHQDWGENSGNYASDYRNPKIKDNWLFEIHTDEIGREVSLCWEAPEAALKGSVLVDMGSKKKHHLKKIDEASYCLPVYMDNAVKQFRWDYHQ
jgi:hypothetical protein